MIKFLGLIFLILLVFGGIAFASGWILIESNGDKANVEIKTGEMEDAAETAVEKSKEWIEKKGEQIDEMTDQDGESVNSPEESVGASTNSGN